MPGLWHHACDRPAGAVSPDSFAPDPVDSNHNFEIDAQDRVFELGGASDQPVVGDWDGDGTDDPGVYHDGVAEVAGWGR